MTITNRPIVAQPIKPQDLHQSTSWVILIIISIYQISGQQFSRLLIGTCNLKYPWIFTVLRTERKMACRFAKVSEEEIVAINEVAFYHPSDVVNTKTTIPLRIGEEWRIYTSALRVSVYIHHYSPPLQGIVSYYYYYLMQVERKKKVKSIISRVECPIGHSMLHKNFKFPNRDLDQVLNTANTKTVQY